MTYPFFSVVQDDFRAVDQLVISSLSSRIPLVEEIATYLVKAGGKRLRPLLVLLCARSCCYQGEQHIKLATVIEFLHTAMLLHDDVVDRSELRRGKKTANANWGNPPSVLVGDFLHSRAFEMMVEIGDLEVMRILSQATNIIAEGEVQQLCSIHNLDISEADYLEIISRKTAKLFEAAAQSAAVLTGATATTEATLKAYGQHLGMAFQLVDDQLDYSGHLEEIGKNTGDDLAQGKVTLPLIIAMRDGTPSQRRLITEAITAGSDSNFEPVMEVLQETGGLDYTLELAAQHRQQALDALRCLDDSRYKTALDLLVNFVVSRCY